MKLVITSLIAAISISLVNAGEKVVPSSIPLPLIPAVESPNWLERGGLWGFAWYDFSDDTFGSGIRLSYDLDYNLALRFDYLVEDFNFTADSFSDTSEITLSMKYDVLKDVPMFPYLIAGGGSAQINSFEWEYLIGAGLEYDFDNGFNIFAEFIHIRSESSDFDDRNELRIGGGIDLDKAIGFLGNMNPFGLIKKEEAPKPVVNNK